MQIIVLFKPDPMVESACLCSKPFRNGSLQKIAIIHHTKLKQKANVPLFCLEHISSISYSIFKNFIWKLQYCSSLIQWWNPRVCAQNRLEMTACKSCLHRYVTGVRSVKSLNHKKAWSVVVQRVGTGLWSYQISRKIAEGSFFESTKKCRLRQPQ